MDENENDMVKPWGIPRSEYTKIINAAKSEIELVNFRKEVKNKEKHSEKALRRYNERLFNAMGRVTFARLTGSKPTFAKLPLPY